MEITMGNAMVYIGIITFSVTVLKCLIINPLDAAIKSLNDSVRSLKECIKVMESNLLSQNIRITRVEESCVSGHHRISRLENLHDSVDTKRQDKQFYD